MKINRRLVIILFILSGLTLVVAAGWMMFKPAELLIQGEVEAAQVKVASKLVGRIKTLHVKEGDSVKQGQLLVTLDSPEIEARMRQAKAAKKAAKAQKLKAYTGLRKEQVRQAYNALQQAKAANELAKKSYRRVANLYKDGVLPQQKLDEAEANMKVAAEREKNAYEAYRMAASGARDEDKLAAAALLERALGTEEEVSSYLQETKIIAPRNGEVAELMGETGELVGSGYPVVSLVDLKDVWVTFNLREDLLKDIRMGSVITGDIPAIGKKGVRFRVNYIKELGLYAVWSATKTSGDFDMKTFEVRAVPETPVQGLRPGMSCLVRWKSSK